MVLMIWVLRPSVHMALSVNRGALFEVGSGVGVDGCRYKLGSFKAA